jgi:selenocysteine-specific elongation factor
MNAVTRFIVVGTAGHIDHGKSALVRALTGTDPDRLKEEQARGITIDLGFAHEERDGITFAFVDVPGHERFVKNMLAGVGGIDLVILVIAADESVMPQTREHFDICRLIGVSRGVIALTKSDLVDRDTLELVRLEVRDLVAGSFLAGAPVLPVSSRTGAGLDDLRAALSAAAHAIQPRGRDGIPRLPIDRVFSVKGFGTVVTGTLVSGEIGLGESLVVLPQGHEVKVRGIQVHGRDVRSAVAGQRAAVNLGHVEVEELARGDTLTAPRRLEPTRRLDARMQLLASARPLKHGARVRFHQGTGETLGRVALSGRAGRTADEPEAGALAVLEPGAEAYVRVRLEAPVVVTRGDRFILRAYSPPATIGGGLVLDAFPPRGGSRTPAARQRFTRLDRAQDREPAAIAVMIDDCAAQGLPDDALVWRVGLGPAAAAAAADAVVRSGQAVRAGDRLVAPRIARELRTRLLEALREHHQAQPLSDGIPREEVRERYFGRASAAVFEMVLAGLVAEGCISARDRVSLAGHRVSLTDEESRARDAIDRAYREGGLRPPDEAAIAAAAGVRPEVIDRMTRLLVREKRLVRLDELLFHADALARLKADVAGLKGAPVGSPPRVDVSAFKERYGITRKFAIPLLEYLDRERVTRRMGETRVVL